MFRYFFIAIFDKDCQWCPNSDTLLSTTAKDNRINRVVVDHQMLNCLSVHLILLLINPEISNLILAIFYSIK